MKLEARGPQGQILLRRDWYDYEREERDQIKIWASGLWRNVRIWHNTASGKRTKQTEDRLVNTEE